MNTKSYDLIVVGGGAGGLVAAKVALGLGKKVAILEKAKLGGECTWGGCIPSKTLIHIASLVEASRVANRFGSQECNLNIDLSKVMEAIHSKRESIYQSHTPQKLEEEGIDIYFGDPKFVNCRNIEVRDKILEAKKFIIATGTRPFIPKIDGLKDIKYLTNETIFELKTLPKSMLILGGGPVGVEIACALNNLGVKITLVEMNKNILPKEDPELSIMLAERMESKGINLRTSLALTKIIKNKEIRFICTQSDSVQVELVAESLLVCVGRSPNIENLNLENIGIKMTPKGILVNNEMQTSVSNIYACGDVVGPYQFSHMAEYQAIIAAQNALIPFFKKSANYNNAIWVTFSDPEFASAGLNEADARDKLGDKIKVFRINYSAIDRAKIDDNTYGMCKIICDSRGYILGAHILGKNAGELIHEIQVGKSYNLQIWDFYKVIHAYPTYSELIWHISKQAYVNKLKQNSFLNVFKKLFFSK